MYRHNVLDIGFIAHPKTASLAAAVALKENGWQTTSQHHTVGKAEKVISVIREPRDWYVSWYFHVHNSDPFADWLPKFLKGANWPYHRHGFIGLEHTTHLIFYERLQQGWDAVMEEMGLQPIELPFLNVEERGNRLAEEFFTPELEKLLDRDLVMVYDSLREQLGDDPFLRI